MTSVADTSIATMNPADVATRLNISVLQVKRLIKSGAIGAVRTGGSDARPRGFMVSEDALRAYLASLPAVVPMAGGGK